MKKRYVPVAGIFVVKVVKESPLWVKCCPCKGREEKVRKEKGGWYRVQKSRVVQLYCVWLGVVPVWWEMERV